MKWKTSYVVIITSFSICSLKVFNCIGIKVDLYEPNYSRRVFKSSTCFLSTTKSVSPSVRWVLFPNLFLTILGLLNIVVLIWSRYSFASWTNVSVKGSDSANDNSKVVPPNTSYLILKSISCLTAANLTLSYSSLEHIIYTTYSKGMSSIILIELNTGIVSKILSGSNPSY